MNLTGKKIIADGDSWFDFPRWLFTGGGVINHLSDLAGVEIKNLAKAGDATQQMLSLGQRQALEKELHGADILLFSGGGNDIAGNQLVTLLNQNRDGDVLKAIAWDRLDAALDLTMAMYDDLDELRNEIAPECLIVTHEYDFAIPRDRGILWIGPWIKPSLEYCGWTRTKDQQDIVKLLLNEFGKRLEDWDAPNHLHISTQGTLSAADWHDEMHPNRSGFNRIARKFLAGLLAHAEPVVETYGGKHLMSHD
jgi:hypothetical protein